MILWSLYVNNGGVLVLFVVVESVVLLDKDITTVVNANLC